MLSAFTKIVVAGLAVGSANALPAMTAPASDIQEMSATTTCTDTAGPSPSIIDLSYTLRPHPNATSSAMGTTIPPGVPVVPTSVLDTSYTLRSDTDSITFTTSDISATKAVGKRAVCTDAGILHECDTAPPAGGSATTYTPSLPSDFTAPVCGETSTHSGSPQVYLMQAVDQVCSKTDWNIMVGPSDTLRWTAKAMDGNDMTFSIDFDWLAVSAEQDSVLFSTNACREGFSKIAAGCKTDAQALMTGGHIEGKYAGVPVTYFVSVDLA
ncbi:hypothetical protein HII31_00961 [Pseudocercospora fuligena]|uniref:Ubiquitin 3 binding protein But2 C-terminal domain-containing protein n=1 Tax=Pseudocercospora fuligena TaxID=685502 RepID=A0A8H6RVW8_9PEZI|nr:hypothetical protein HII31_00961 [Pseudocercospora fuligena]